MPAETPTPAAKVLKTFLEAEAIEKNKHRQASVKLNFITRDKANSIGVEFRV